MGEAPFLGERHWPSSGFLFCCFQQVVHACAETRSDGELTAVTGWIRWKLPQATKFCL